MIPHIAPAASREWAGASRTSPRSTSRAASPGSAAQPSKTMAPQTALRWGAHMRSHSIGGPACSTMRPSSPGISSPAGPAPTIIGRASMSRSSARALAASTRSSP